MNVLQLDAGAYEEFRLDRSVSWWDPEAECTLVMSQPSVDRDLWHDYLRGAERSYRKHGVERALDVPAIRAGDDTSIFWAAVDIEDRVIGGLRVKGPLKCVEDSHAVVEWAGQPGLLEARKMIQDRLPFGVVEMKSAWVTDDRNRNRSVTILLARTALHSMTLLDAQFGMATAASHVIARWLSSGGVLASRVPPSPYPDDRYQTKMIWWDRYTFANYAEPKQASKTAMEMISLNQQLNQQSKTVARQVSAV